MTVCPSCADLQAELANVRAELAVELSRRTLGGTPPGYHSPSEWANRLLPPPETASDPDAPPLARGFGGQPGERQ